MYSQGKERIKEILALVDLCPDSLKEKCFELLLQGYVLAQSKPAAAPPSQTDDVSSTKAEPNHEKEQNNSNAPDLIKPRLTALAGRTNVSVKKATALFDFNVDPFNYHAAIVPGATGSNKMRNVALMLCVKSYLVNATWSADWKEFRATCIDHNCWNQTNFTKYMNYEWFKNASSSDDIALSPSGIKAAELLFAQLASTAEEPG